MELALKVIGAIVAGLAGWWIVHAVIDWAFPGWWRPMPPDDDERPADRPRATASD